MDRSNARTSEPTHYIDRVDERRVLRDQGPNNVNLFWNTCQIGARLPKENKSLTVLRSCLNGDRHCLSFTVERCFVTKKYHTDIWTRDGNRISTRQFCQQGIRDLGNFRRPSLEPRRGCGCLQLRNRPRRTLAHTHSWCSSSRSLRKRSLGSISGLRHVYVSLGSRSAPVCSG